MPYKYLYYLLEGNEEENVLILSVLLLFEFHSLKLIIQFFLCHSLLFKRILNGLLTFVRVNVGMFSLYLKSKNMMLLEVRKRMH